MPITADDIKLLASQRMTDTTDGGGRRTSNIIPDGTPGNIFPKVSRLDSVYGRVNLRKVYGAVTTADTDTYAGAHAVITDAPDNDRIHVTLFSTKSDFDERTAARDRIESFVIAGPESRMRLYGRQLVGQGAITVYQTTDVALPEIGGVLCLSTESGVSNGQQQFVRITDIEQEVRTFEDDRGTYQRRVLMLKISTPLRFEFTGQENVPRASSTTRISLVRNTTVADASRYFGVQKLAAPAAQNALAVTVDSVYSPIVPTTQRESALSNVEMVGANNFLAAAAGTCFFTHPDFISPTAGTTVWLGGPIVPGTLSGTVQPAIGGLLWYLSDDGAGTVTPYNSVSTTPPRAMSIDYETGLLKFFAPTAGWDNSTALRPLFSFIPAAPVSQVAHTSARAITLNTRGTVYVESLDPLPTPGSTIVDYRALGKWYRLRDNGRGELLGDDPAYGAGSVNYATGALVVTLGALPDIGSEVLYAWGSGVHYEIATSDAGTTVRQTLQLADVPVSPGSVQIQFLATTTTGGTPVTQTATADASGVISGAGCTGTVNYDTGAIAIEYGTRLPDPGTNVTVNYTLRSASNPAQPVTVSGTAQYAGSGQPSVIEAGAPIAGLATNIPILVPGFLDAPATVVRIDVVYNAVAGLIYSAARTFTAGGRNWTHAGGQVLGALDAATGEISWRTASGAAGNPVLTVSTTYFQRLANGLTWTKNYAYSAPMVAGDLPWRVTTTSAATNVGTTVNFAVNSNPLQIDLTKTSTNSVVPQSVRFFMTQRYFFDSNGKIRILGGNPGESIEVGEIDYESGMVTLSSGWRTAQTVGLVVGGCLTTYGKYDTQSVQFRTAGAPLRSQSTFVQALTLNGETVSGTSNADGIISGSKLSGTVNIDTGVVKVDFTEPVSPASIRYSAVALSNLPLDAEILGLDPVRLPSDGRVAIYRPADVVVLHNTKSFALPNSVTAGATYSVGRTNLSELWLVDANNARVPTSQYVVNLAAGTVTMAAVLSLGALVQPFTARHRIEEMNLLSDVQINGQLSLTGPLTRAYDGDTLVSSALLFGDLFARATNVFDQTSWTSVWSDARIGTNATAEYNTVDWPIEVRNDGAVTERWRINFTSTTAYQVIGENLGVIATGTTTVDCAPVNQLTGQPYFMLRAGGWGIGWATGNQLRFNTLGATAPIWLARTVLPGATLAGDSIDLQLRGDVDA
jgi:hypothetical protein